jgi:aspartyl/asparaginyl beta-hydroxylase (cupin superfamily)
MSGIASSLVLEADAAAASGNVERARELLSRAIAVDTATAETWLKLAAMCRSMGDPSAALVAVEGALAISPLDFTALLLRASLLERLGNPGSGEAYSRALAQRPEVEPPPAMAAIIVHAEQRRSEHLAEREARLEAAVITVPLSAEERARIARLRSNALRQTHPYHSEPSHFHFPGLREREFHDRATFAFLSKLEAATDIIAEEFAAVAAAERKELVPYIQYGAHEPLRQWQALNHSSAWSVIHLIKNGRALTANARHCPRTMGLLAEIDQPKIAGCSPNAMFSLLAPGTLIPSHTGVANTRLVCHLPIIVPDGCWFRVGETKRTWRRGEAFIFDDTIEHEAMNPSQELRVVLIFDIWHPDLSAAERQAVAALIAADFAGGAMPL